MEGSVCCAGQSVARVTSCRVPPWTQARGPAVDGLALRMAQGTTAVLVLTGFVFGFPWLVGVVAVVSGVGAIGGPARQPFLLGYTALFASRPSTLPDEDAAVVPRAEILLAASSSSGPLALVSGVGTLGWGLALIAALVAAMGHDRPAPRRLSARPPPPRLHTRSADGRGGGRGAEEECEHGGTRGAAASASPARGRQREENAVTNDRGRAHGLTRRPPHRSTDTAHA